ncbi:serine/threonine protein kinase [Saccharothrix tamanrassetensis]|uniref:non-specific serine/threonine protein kinase n=1 Tax=Saccharothrix tamanrassetensis TaxID=1051531 RepID=A0A841CCW3_9PSEU|nr:serine/threonine-protein kinase [Saccharothrix tamanrassetensis]MBB5954018.1 serine/threonine protein kinase [Saccharothrix tamanrassetensis]
MDASDDLNAWAPQPSAGAAPAISLAGYSDFRLVAHGGEGTVYRAHQDGLGRDVAVKVLDVTDPDTVARFRRELEITVRLGRRHPHIVTVLDTGSIAGRPCIVMEYYDLGSLHDSLRQRGPLPVSEVIAAGMAVADALAFAHGEGILHRDVKPQNILVLPTSYVLADFGIARGADAGHSASLQLVSYRHAAPQMVQGQRPAASDDLWSLGSTLFTLLDGQPPFASSTPEQDTMLGYLGRVQSSPPRSLTRRDVPPELVALIMRCLSKAREDRFPDATALRAALAAVPTRAPQSTVDPDHTAAVRRQVPERFPEGPTSIPDFGPRPAPEAPQVTEAEDVATPEPVRTWTEDLADLTVRHDVPSRPVVPPPAPPVVTLPEPPPEPRRSRRALVFASVAVVAGIAAGVLLSTQERGDGRASPPSTTTTTSDLPVPSTTDATIPEGADPKYQPTLKRLEDGGSSIELFWTDPSGGQAHFVVVDVTGPKPQALVRVAAGSTSHKLEGLDPEADQYCFQLIAIGLVEPGTNKGSSARTCAVRNR